MDSIWARDSTNRGCGYRAASRSPVEPGADASSDPGSSCPFSILRDCSSPVEGSTSFGLRYSMLSWVEVVPAMDGTEETIQ
ncbi:hypothetical protein JZ751_006899 [Albula glossodonta]|uniref:Uncharacterized protein n=1 Tax=Albula glossodonta TaxID=121402 RepID=A0A8T2PAP6_9TELE|nr:hypothetical protein JZ751_006899 [Albula glossodonta]